MKKAISILTAYLTCTDPAMKTKWADILASYWHKDAGKMVTSITKATNGDVTVTILDGAGKSESTTIQKTQLPTSYDVSFINGLNGILNNKVEKVAGKGLSTNDLTDALKLSLNSIPKDVKDLADSTGLLTHPSTSVKIVPLGTSSEIDFLKGDLFTKTKTAATTFIFKNPQLHQIIQILSEGDFTSSIQNLVNPLDFVGYDRKKKNLTAVQCVDVTPTKEKYLIIGHKAY